MSENKDSIHAECPKHKGHLEIACVLCKIEEKEFNKLEEINDFLEDADMSALSADGFDDAILGVATDFNSEARLVYSITGCINILMQRDGMTYIDAMEHFSFNVQGSYVGEQTPIWVDDCMFEVILGEM